jgi:phosphatidylserine/phosphatidylglycerophosphate/cardiolipin synthase-like enzyme
MGPRVRVKSWLVASALVAAGLLAAGEPAPRVEPAASRVELSTDHDPIARTREAIAGARASVDAVVYKFDEPSLRPALEAALARGVAVRLLVDAKEADDSDSQVDAVRHAGAVVRRWSRERGKLHAKFTTIDGALVLTGSFNWTRSAGGKNVEVLLELSEPELVDRFSALFDRLWREAAAGD